MLLFDRFGRLIQSTSLRCCATIAQASGAILTVSPLLSPLYLWSSVPNATIVPSFNYQRFNHPASPNLGRRWRASVSDEAESAEALPVNDVVAAVVELLGERWRMWMQF